LRFATDANDADGQAKFRANLERLGKVVQGTSADDQPAEKSEVNAQSEAQPEQQKRSWKQWLTGK
jgi:hypothetical protein